MYQRLPGTGYRRLVPGYIQVLLFFAIGIFVLLLRGRRVQLWTGDNQLLLVESDGRKEYYKRFQYLDIQSLSIRKTLEGRIINSILGAGFGLLVLGMIVNPDSDVRILLAVIAALPACLLLINSLAGPTCVCELRTAVTKVDLPSLQRVSTARKAFARLRPLIFSAQGQLSPEEIRARLRPVSPAEPVAPVATLIEESPPAPEHPPG